MKTKEHAVHLNKDIFSANLFNVNSFFIHKFSRLIISLSLLLVLKRCLALVQRDLEDPKDHVLHLKRNQMSKN